MTASHRSLRHRLPLWIPLLIGVASLVGCGGGGAGGDAVSREQPKLIGLGGGAAIPANAYVNGMWGPVNDWPLIPLHSVLLTDGRVLSFGTTETGKQTGFFIYDVWDPSLGTGPSSHLTLPNQTATDIFCASVVQLPSGSGVSISGGDVWNGTTALNVGNSNTTFFNPSDNTLVKGNSMSRPRWYGTSTVLLNGEVLVQGGQGGADRADVRGLDGKYRQLSPDTSTYSWNFPRNFVAADGRVFGFDVFGAMYYWDTAGTGTQTYAGGFNATRGEDSSAAQFRPGKVLQFGGTSNQALVIDFSGGGSPVVTPTQAMSSQRSWVNSAILPNGTVLATGGSRVYNTLTDVNNSAEIWDPVTGTWKVGASGSLARLYHSMSLLMPDGSVMVGGGGAPGPLVNTNMEMYYPSYLFTSAGTLATRPVISGAPTVTDIGATVWVDIASSRPISRVTMIKTGAVTHSFNTEQRFLELTFVRQGNRLAVQMPTVAGHAPPGHYMLFAIDDAGVPSVAPIIRMNIAPALNAAVMPVLAQPANPSSEAGKATSLQLSASDPNGDTLTYNAAGLPPGMAVNAATGLISGTPSTSGSYTVTATATDGVNTASRTFTWTVTAAVSSVIVAPAGDAPAPASVAGVSAGFSALASGTGIQYSWNFGDGSAATAWSTSGTAQHTFLAPGAYVVTVTAKNNAGSTGQYSYLQSVRLAATTGKPVSSSALAVEPRAGGAFRMWMVNQDNNSVSVFDGASRARLAEIGVGDSPRNIALAGDGRMWVTNKASATVTMIDTGSLSVVGAFALPMGSRPHGIVMSSDGSSAYIAMETTGQVMRISTSTLDPLASAWIGTNTRGLALDAAGTGLFVSRFVTTMQPGESTATVSSTQSGAITGGEVIVLNPATMAQIRTVMLAHSTRPDTEASGRGVPNYVGATAISPDGTHAWVPSKQDNIMRGLRRDGNPLDFQNTVRAIASRINLSTQVEDYSARIDLDNASVASAAAFDPSGVYLFVALETSRQVAVVDAHRGVELFRVDTGRAPQSLAVSPNGQTLFVENFMDRTLGAYDLRPLVLSGQQSAPALTPTVAIATERLAPQVLTGKQIFYDARDTRLARDRYMSCASCHNDGGHDGRVWDLSNLGEGLRRTIGLRGKGLDGGQGFRHWSGNFDETQDFEGQIRTLAGGTGLMSNAAFNAGTTSQPLGDTKAGKSADLDALAAYLASLTVHDDSPWYPGTWIPAVVDGKTLFADLNCASCHGGTAFTSSGNATLFNIGTIKPTSGNRLAGALTGIDPPTLRGLWTQNAYLHDGSASSVEGAILAHNNVTVTSVQAANLAAYLRTVGAQETSAPVNPATGSNGLAAAYFGNADLTGAAGITRNEAVDFSWVGVGPGAGLPADYWSVRWTGAVVLPENGTYRLQVIADDGLRLRINGAVVADNWKGNGNVTYLSDPIVGTAGMQVPIQIEHYDGTGDSTVRLRWITPSATKYYVPIPMENLRSTSASNSAPTVTLSAPTAATIGVSVTLSASAADADGTVTKVEFFDGAVNIGTSTTSPFGLSWIPTSGGVHNMTARATDNAGTSTTSAMVGVTVSASNLAPTVTLVTPTSAAVGSPTVLSATASDSDGSVVRVDFYDGTTLIGTKTGAPFDVTWTPSTVGVRSLTARATDNSGASTTSATVNVTVGSTVTSGGLRGEYFANATLAGTPMVTRNEAIDFVWASAFGTTIPAPGLPADNWSVRWTGSVQFSSSGSHQFQITADDGIRVWINGTLAVDNWKSSGNVTYLTNPINGVAGTRLPIVIEHYDGSGDSTVRLRWITPDSPVYYVPVPVESLYSSVANAAPTVSLSTPTVATVGSPVTLAANASDSDGSIAKVDFYDGTALIGTKTTSPFNLTWTPATAGARTLTARATDDNGASTTSASVGVTVSAAPTPGGLRGEYFANTSLAGTPVMTRVEPVTFVWATATGTAVPGPAVPADNWSVRWTGWVRLPADGTYTFQVISDDGIRVSSGSSVLADKWVSNGNTTYVLSTVTGVAGTLYPVTIEHFDGTGDSTVKLRWQIPGSPYWWDIAADQLLSN